MAAVTAHAGLDVLVASRRRDPREVIHAVLDAPLHLTDPGPLGTADRAAGEAVCAELSEFGEPPAALWEPVITCPGCAVLVRAWGIELVSTNSHAAAFRARLLGQMPVQGTGQEGSLVPLPGRSYWSAAAVMPVDTTRDQTVTLSRVTASGATGSS